MDEVMNSTHGLRAAKSFEEQGPIVVWQVSASSITQLKKFYIILDANQKSFGVRLETARSDDVKVGGAFVTQLRKQLPSGYIPGVLRSIASGDLWVPFFMGQSPKPVYWIMLARTLPPEVRLIDHEGLIHVRKSSQGSYTKKRELGSPLPEWPAQEGFENILPAILAPWQSVSPEDGGTKQQENSSILAIDVEESKKTTAGSSERELPEYQKTGRDRLARRAKTLRKSLVRLETEHAAVGDAGPLEKKASLLRQHLHTITSGMASLDVTDDDGTVVTLSINPHLSSGALLEEAFESIKKMRRAQVKLKVEVEKARSALRQAEADLTLLRGYPLAFQTVEKVLASHHLALEKPSVATREGVTPQALPYKVYAFKSDRFKGPVRILVGKGAEGSDTLVKEAKANDLWFHIVGSTGSHVIIPARDLSGITPPDDLLRTAGILAVFHSKQRESLSGEVYFSRRQNIRKRKGMAPGLWQIDKAETTIMRFDDDELRSVLAMAAP
jgi:hypothetical protein